MNTGETSDPPDADLAGSIGDFTEFEYIALPPVDYINSWISNDDGACVKAFTTQIECNWDALIPVVIPTSNNQHNFILLLFNMERGLVELMCCHYVEVAGKREWSFGIAQSWVDNYVKGWRFCQYFTEGSDPYVVFSNGADFRVYDFNVSAILNGRKWSLESQGTFSQPFDVWEIFSVNSRKYFLMYCATGDYRVTSFAQILNGGDTSVASGTWTAGWTSIYRKQANYNTTQPTCSCRFLCYSSAQGTMSFEQFSLSNSGEWLLNQSVIAKSSILKSKRPNCKAVNLPFHGRSCCMLVQLEMGDAPRPPAPPSTMPLEERLTFGLQLIIQEIGQPFSEIQLCHSSSSSIPQSAVFCYNKSTGDIMLFDITTITIRSRSSSVASSKLADPLPTSESERTFPPVPPAALPPAEPHRPERTEGRDKQPRLSSTVVEAAPAGDESPQERDEDEERFNALVEQLEANRDRFSEYEFGIIETLKSMRAESLSATPHYITKALETFIQLRIEQTDEPEPKRTWVLPPAVPPSLARSARSSTPDRAGQWEAPCWKTGWHYSRTREEQLERKVQLKLAQIHSEGMKARMVGKVTPATERITRPRMIGDITHQQFIERELKTQEASIHQTPRFKLKNKDVDLKLNLFKGKLSADAQKKVIQKLVDDDLLLRRENRNDLLKKMRQELESHKDKGPLDVEAQDRLNERLHTIGVKIHDERITELLKKVREEDDKMLRCIKTTRTPFHSDPEWNQARSKRLYQTISNNT